MLDIRIGIHTEQGPRANNQDFAAAHLGDRISRARHGVIAVVADGVAGAKGGRVASETVARGVIEGFLDTSPSLGVRQAMAPVIEALNEWICTQGRQDPDLDRMATTMTTLVVRDRRAHVLHVGDSRLYLFRDGELIQLTTDHVPDQPDQRHILLRAIGLASGVRIDYASRPVARGDRFVLCSDGLHGYLADGQIHRVLLQALPPEQTARALAEAALAAGGRDNVTVLVAEVVDLAPADMDELTADIAALPIPPLPNAGETVDGFLLTSLLADGRYARVFRAKDTTDDDRETVLKFPKPTFNDNPAFRASFAREQWVGGQIRSHLIGEMLTLAPERQTRLYLAQPFYEGATLEERLGRPAPVSLREGIGFGILIAKAVAKLHGAGVVHRDIKPENVILTGPGSLRLMDLGIARLPGRDDRAIGDGAGTASYRAPEMFDGAPGDEATDIYALGVTLYRIFAKAYPYGEIEPFSRPHFGMPAPLSRHRPDLPHWLELLLERAVAVDRNERPATALVLALELENGLADQAAANVRSRLRKPFIERQPVRFWQLVCVILLLLVLALLLRH